MKSSGPKMSPCLTPIVLLILLMISLTTNFTSTLAWMAFKRRINFAGTPKIFNTFFTHPNQYNVEKPPEGVYISFYLDLWPSQ